MQTERRQLLADSAALARGLAREHCWHGAGADERCDWYHGFWPYMRLLDYGSSPELHKAFYISALASLAAEPRSARVLISGAADFAMLEVAAEAFGHATAPPYFTVVDRCDTPLALCRWYAERSNLAIETLARDILQFSDAEGFDAIVTHSFLGSFPAEKRADLVARWFALLRPGGCLLTINRIRGEEAAASVPFSEEESSNFIARLTRDLDRYRDLLDAPPSEIARLAEGYLRQKRSYPVRSREELAGLLESAGFRLEEFNELEASDPGTPRPSGPTMPGNATYLKVIARKPS